MAPGRRKHEGVAVVETSTTAPAEHPSVAESPLYGVAMLKVAMELKKPNPPPLDDILSHVLGRMGLDEGAFRRYLVKNGGLLRSIAERKQP